MKIAALIALALAACPLGAADADGSQQHGTE